MECARRDFETTVRYRLNATIRKVRPDLHLETPDLTLLSNIKVTIFTREKKKFNIEYNLERYFAYK